MSNFSFKKDGRPKIKKGKKGNPEGLTLKQHSIPAFIINKWKNKEGKLNFFYKKQNELLETKNERDERFCVDHNWDDSCEKQGTFIENEFFSFADFVNIHREENKEIIFNLNFQLTADKYFDLMCFRNLCIDNRLKQQNVDVDKGSNGGFMLKDYSFMCFSLDSSSKDEDIFPETHEQMCENEKRNSSQYNIAGQFIKKENGKYYWDNSYKEFYYNITSKYLYDYSILDIDKKLNEGKYWIFVEHERVILPDRWTFVHSSDEKTYISKFISFSPYVTIMPFFDYYNFVKIAKLLYYSDDDIKKFLADRLNCCAKLSYKNWYIL